jgi:hypothetical protein
MTYLTFAEHCTSRWNTLLAESRVLDQEYVDLVSSFKPPFSRKQVAQLEACAAQRADLTRKLQVLVEDWTKTRRVD